jgi:hypothetical protein
MAYQKLTTVFSSRDGANKITKTTINAAGNDGLMFDGSTQKCTLIIDNDSGGAIAFETVNAPGQEAKVDDQAVANKVAASLANGETYELGPFPLVHYGNDDPDASGIAAGKAILVHITSGDGAKVYLRENGPL